MIDYSLDEGHRRWRERAVPSVRYRQTQQQALIAACIQVANRYNAEYAIPVAGTDSDSPTPVLTPALINEAIDQPAIRAASVNPSLTIPSLTNSDLSKGRADVRRKILASTYFRSNLDLLRRRFYRQIAGYGWASMVVLPEESRDTRDGQPLARIALRNALSTYADPQAAEDIDFPKDVGFVHQMSASLLRFRYPQSMEENGGIIPPPEKVPGDSEMYDVLEWLDESYCLIGIMGRTRDMTPQRLPYGGEQLLYWYPNRAGFVPAVVPKVITLDKLVSRLTHMMGKVDVMAYLFELDIEAMQRAIAPDRYVIAADGEVPAIVSNAGQWIDGRTGQVNLVQGVKAIGELRGAPDPNNLARIQAIEKNAMMEAGLIGAQQGDTSGYAGALRTGRGIDSLLAASVDPRIAELQEIGAKSLQIINEAVFAVYQAYWPDREFRVFSGWAGDRSMVDFHPGRDIETRANAVYYPLPGSDAYSQTVQLGQMVQMDMISRSSARRMHPWVDDAEAEERSLSEERIDTLIWQAIAARAQGGGLTPVDAARIKQLIAQGKSIEDAVVQADDEAKKRQAGAEQTPGAPGAQQAPDVAAQPGLAQPGEGGGGPPPPGGGQGQLTAQSLMAALAAQPQPGGAPPQPQGAPATAGAQ